MAYKRWQRARAASLVISSSAREAKLKSYFYLQQLGYRMVATNFRVAHDRGEIDLIGWDGDMLCFSK